MEPQRKTARNKSISTDPESSERDQYAVADLCAANPWYVRKALRQGKDEKWLRVQFSGIRNSHHITKMSLRWDYLLDLERLGDVVEIPFDRHLM